MKKYPTQYQKRKLLYQRKAKEQFGSQKHPLDLPSQFRSKISGPEYKKMKQAFYIHSTADIDQQLYTINRQQFVNLLRSLGIVAKTTKIYEQFDQYRCKQITWEFFLKIYLNLRTQKGSYNELSAALNQLEKEYKGDWDYLEEDLMNIGDILSPQEMEVFGRQIMGDQPLTKQVLLDVLLGYK